MIITFPIISNSQYKKTIWQCVTGTKKGKKFCPNSKGIEEILKEFDRYVFESIVEKVVVGEVDENGNVDPYKLTFVYKTGFKDDLDGGKFKTPRKNASSKNKRIGKDSAELSSYTSNHVNKSYSHSSDDTCGMFGIVNTQIIDSNL